MADDGFRKKDSSVVYNLLATVRRFGSVWIPDTSEIDVLVPSWVPS